MMSHIWNTTYEDTIGDRSRNPSGPIEVRSVHAGSGRQGVDLSELWWHLGVRLDHFISSCEFPLFCRVTLVQLVFVPRGLLTHTPAPPA